MRCLRTHLPLIQFEALSAVFPAASRLKLPGSGAEQAPGLREAEQMVAFDVVALADKFPIGRVTLKIATSFIASFASI